MHRAILLATLASLTVLAGCLDDAGTDSFDTDAVQEQSLDMQAASGGGSAESHGDPVHEWSDIETEYEPTRFAWKATQTGTIRNDFGGADTASVFLAVPAGSIQVVPDSTDGYLYEFTITAYQQTQQGAREEVERVTVLHEDRLDDEGGLLLDTRVEHEPVTQLGGIINIGTARTVQVDLVAHVPAGPLYGLQAVGGSADLAVTGLQGPTITTATSSGDITLSDLVAYQVRAETASGDVEADGIQAQEVLAGSSSGTQRITSAQADRIAAYSSSGDIVLHDVQAISASLGTSSGDIQVTESTVQDLEASTSSGSHDYDGMFRSLALDSSSGDILATLGLLGSGSIQAHTSSGSIGLGFNGLSEDNGFDVVADTSSGDIDIDLPDLLYTEQPGEDHVRARTAGYEHKAVQTTLALQSSSGDITVQG